jgi:hypothetical protein
VLCDLSKKNITDPTYRSLSSNTNKEQNKDMFRLFSAFHTWESLNAYFQTFLGVQDAALGLFLLHRLAIHHEERVKRFVDWTKSLCLPCATIRIVSLIIYENKLTLGWWNTGCSGAVVELLPRDWEVVRSIPARNGLSNLSHRRVVAYTQLRTQCLHKKNNIKKENKEKRKKN